MYEINLEIYFLLFMKILIVNAYSDNQEGNDKFAEV